MFRGWVSPALLFTVLFCFTSLLPADAPWSRAQKAKPSSRHSTTKTKVAPARSRKLHRAFVASADLKPMAKQLLSDRTPVAYAGVERYAQRHRADEAGTLARLVLGYAHLLDKDFAKATTELKRAAARDGELADYAEYFLAESAAGTQDQQQVATLLKGFSETHPDSLLKRDTELMRASALVSIGQANEAARLLEAMRDGGSDIELVLGRAYAAEGRPEQAAAAWNHIYAELPLSKEAPAAQAELEKISRAGVVVAPTLNQRRTRADLLMKGHRYDQAVEEYRGILDSIRSDLSQRSDQRVLEVKLGAALFRSRHLGEAKSLLESVSEGGDEVEAERLFYLHEIARSNDDGDKERELISRLTQRFPTSPWLQEGLLSAGGMYLLRRDYPHALEYSSAQYKLFPEGKYSPHSHWKAAWLTLRSGNRAEAKRLLEEQIALYGAGQEAPPALYWRARLAEEENDYDRAGEYYTLILRRFVHYYYADLARERLKFHFNTSKHDPLLDKVPDASQPLKASFDPPLDDLRLARSRLLSNAALFDFAIRELQSQSDKLWAQAEIAKIYLDDGRPDRALQTLKHAVPTYFSAGIHDLPAWAWEILFPRPYWNDLRRYATVNGLDPYLVASLIRQESEFNPQAVSRANAYGLMQVLPGNGKKLAKELRIRHYRQDELIDPVVNLELGTRYFKHMVEEFGGQVEYALAAYNAGSDRVKDWKNEGPYRDIHEFVESIPFTETREYVEAIMRNATVYRLLYSGENSRMRAAR